MAVGAGLLVSEDNMDSLVFRLREFKGQHNPWSQGPVSTGATREAGLGGLTHKPRGLSKERESGQ